MMIHDFAQIQRPFNEVRSVILGNASSLLGRSATAAYREGEQLSLRLEPFGGHPRLSKRVVLDLGPAYERDDRLVLPIHWWALSGTRLFPHLEGDLELAPIGDEVTQVTLMGRYDPPLAGIGRTMDRLLLHRIAEACVRSFLTKVGEALAAQASFALVE